MQSETGTFHPGQNTEQDQDFVLSLQELPEHAAGGGNSPDVMTLHSFLSIMTDCGTGGFTSMYCTL